MWDLASSLGYERIEDLVLALGSEPGEILFVSSNGWDVAGAKAFGYRTCWCNRLGAPVENLGVTPDLEVSRLDEILTKLG